ncbi:transposase [uncultured Leptotrichia sp.]|nr:transposase [uncultured Leptotrichia sp.]
MKFSKNWYKQKSKISKLHGYIKNCRRDFLNKLSKKLFGIIRECPSFCVN